MKVDRRAFLRRLAAAAAASAIEPARAQERYPSRPITLVLPYAACLHTPSGRNYLRIIPQLADQFPTWRVEDELSPPNLRRILSELERRARNDDAVGRERVIGAIMLLTTAMAERARAIDLAVKTDLDERRFVANLVDMLVAVIEAPAGPPPP